MRAHRVPRTETRRQDRHARTSTMRNSTWLVLGLCLAGCATSANGSEPDPLASGLAELEVLQATVNIRVEEATARCMREAGFDYVPTTSTAPAPAMELDSDEFIDVYGYGISTITIAGTEPFDPAVAGPKLDANSAIVSALDHAETAAYLDAMFGPADGALPSGCFNTSRAQITGPFDTFMAVHGQELVELWRRVDSDPDMSAARDAWAKCMRRDGYGGVSPESIRESFSARLAALAANEGDALMNLRAEERATAKADSICRHREMDAVTNRLMAEQQRVLETSQSALFDDLSQLTGSKTKTSQGSATMHS
jgi:hypothetical protein